MITASRWLRKNTMTGWFDAVISHKTLPDITFTVVAWMPNCGDYCRAQAGDQTYGPRMTWLTFIASTRSIWPAFNQWGLTRRPVGSGLPMIGFDTFTYGNQADGANIYLLPVAIMFVDVITKSYKDAIVVSIRRRQYRAHASKILWPCKASWPVKSRQHLELTLLERYAHEVFLCDHYNQASRI